MFVIVILCYLDEVASESAASVAMDGDAEVELHRPVGKDGDGEYSAATKGCFDVINVASAAVLSSVEAMELPAPGSRAFTVADYGTADAGTSLGLISKVVDAVRAKGGDALEVNILYEDQKDNEWRSVFNHALGYRAATDAYGVVQKVAYTPENGVFVSASGIGFHSQAFPSNSVDLAVSFTAMHWLSKAPSSLVGQPEMHSARLDQPPAKEEKQAAEDWQRILQARANELRVGGRMVIVNFCKSKEGYFLGQTGHGASMWESFKTSWAKLQKDGLIDAEEALGVSFPNYYRSNAEVTAGINNIPGLSLVGGACEEKVVPCPYRENWVSGKSKRTPREHAEWFVPTTRTWSESTFKAGLRGDRSEEDKDAIMATFWSNYADLVEADPAAHHMDYAHLYCTIEKTA